MSAMAKVSGYAVVGCDPQYMGLGPYYAVKQLLRDKELTTDDIDVFEINEAFAAQALASIKLLGEEFGVPT